MRHLLAAFGIVLLAIVLWLNYAGIKDAYGSGAPYYSRTENMDKWTNPLPILVPLDVLALAGGVIWIWRSRRRR